jgi:hypothetical protein
MLIVCGKTIQFKATKQGTKLSIEPNFSANLMLTFYCATIIVGQFPDILQFAPLFY